MLHGWHEVIMNEFYENKKQDKVIPDTFHFVNVYKLPKGYVEKGLELAKGASFFGVPIEDLTRDELIACAINGWQEVSNVREEGIRQRNF
jgi:hypothetical protein